MGWVQQSVLVSLVQGKVLAQPSREGQEVNSVPWRVVLYPPKEAVATPMEGGPDGASLVRVVQNCLSLRDGQLAQGAPHALCCAKLNPRWLDVFGFELR